MCNEQHQSIRPFIHRSGGLKKFVQYTRVRCTTPPHQMKRATVLLWCSLIFNCGAHEELYCRWSEASLAPPDSSVHRKYAPDRNADILHVALDVTPDFHERSIQGEATLRFKPNAKPLHELKLD